VARLVCHPDAMTPDANPLLGPMPGLRGFWVAAGLSLNGFGGGGGIGRSIAGWITANDPGVDSAPYRAWRFADTYRDPLYGAALARDAYADYYRLRFPYDTDTAARPRRLSAVHGRLQEAGAVFGTKAGWERADYHEPGSPPVRAGRSARSEGWRRPPWFDRVGAEHRAVRERAGIIDLSSFGKIEVEGSGALELLQWVAANDVDRLVGSAIYTQFLDVRGGIVADVTVTRLGEDRFRVLTGAGYLAADMGWLRAKAADVRPGVMIRDATDAWSVIGLWGPDARGVLAAASSSDVSDAAIPPRQARTIEVAGATVLATRLSYAGELGWELTVAPEWAVAVWDALLAAGREVGTPLEPIGYRALESLRLEKGYRYYGAELTTREMPDEAGLGAFVRLRKPAFVGREAVLAQRAAAPAGSSRRLRTIALGGEAWLPIYGGEAVRIDGQVVGRLRSAAFGYTVGRTIGTVYLDAATPEGTPLTVDVFDGEVEGIVTADVLHDPEGERLRG
jgi:glycine cleavage system aminomethyltransferase T